MYKGYCSPFMNSYEDDKFEDGVLTTTGCFSRHNIPRRDQEQDNFKHQPLFDYKPMSMFEKFKFFQTMYEFKEVYQE